MGSSGDSEGVAGRRRWSAKLIERDGGAEGWLLGGFAQL